MGPGGRSAARVQRVQRVRPAFGRLVQRVADCRSAAMLIKSALRIHLSVSYGMIGILLIGSLRSPPPIQAAPDFPLCRGQNRFLCFPVETWPQD